MGLLHGMESVERLLSIERADTGRRAGGALVGVEAVGLLTVWYGLLGVNPFATRPAHQALVLAAVAASVQVLVLMRRGRYRGTPYASRTEEVEANLVSVLAAGGAVMLVAELVDWAYGASELLLGAVAAGVVVAASGERRRERRAHTPGEPVVVVGTGQEAWDLIELIDDHSDVGMRTVGVIGNADVADQHGLSDRWLGPVDDMVEILRDAGASLAVVASSSFRSDSHHRIVETLRLNGYRVALSSGISRVAVARHEVSSVAHEPIVILETHRVLRSSDRTRRVIDVLGAAVGLLVFSPFLVLAVIAIKVTSEGPVLYRQTRIGSGGEPFVMLKLRTMTVGADAHRDALADANERAGPLFKVSNDPRVTTAGRVLRRLSIDEIPQLVNVLKGEMSLVGPRPALPSEVRQFDDELRRRADIRPGVTGLWQVEARSNASFSAYRRLDLHYLENRTVWLDLCIIGATVQLLVVGALTRVARQFLSRPTSSADGVDRKPVLDLTGPHDVDPVDQEATEDPLESLSVGSRKAV